MPDVSLICMRLENMVFHHPDEDKSRVCSQCGRGVGIFPSGQRVLAKMPSTKILCEICGRQSPLDLVAPAPGSIAEAIAAMQGRKVQ